MKKIKEFGIIVTVLIILIAGCSDPKEGNEKVYPANIIVLLDLSDRVSIKKHPEKEHEERVKEQINDDKDNCQTIIEVFDSIVNKETYSNSKSKLRFFIPDQLGFQIDSERKKELRVFGKIPVGNFSKFDGLKIGIIAAINRLYGEVLTAPQTKFTGADIWSWFKYDAKRYLDPEFRNYIICISDGYLDFNENIQDKREKGTFITINNELRKSDDWKKNVYGEFKLRQPRGVDFSQYEVPVKFLMIGIKDRTYDGSLSDRDILEAYWRPWLESMGIEVEANGFIPSDVGKEEIAAFLEAVP